MSRDQDPGRAHDFSALLVTPLTERLGCRYPIIQTTMGWVADANLVIATTRVGGFGFLAGATIDADKLEGEIRKVIAATGGSNFGLNFHMFQENIEAVDDAAQVLAVDAAVRRLEAIDPRLAQVVVWRYFAGLEEAEIADALAVTERTVRRDWVKARTLLADLLGDLS